MSLFSKITGVLGSFFQIGGPSGPGINNNAGTIEHLNSGGTTYTDARALMFEYQQAVPTTESITILTGNTILLAQDWANSGHVALQGTARIVWVM